MSTIYRTVTEQNKKTLPAVAQARDKYTSKMSHWTRVETTRACSYNLYTEKRKAAWLCSDRRGRMSSHNRPHRMSYSMHALAERHLGEEQVRVCASSTAYQNTLLRDRRTYYYVG